jgi:hypothetical protein
MRITVRKLQLSGIVFAASLGFAATSLAYAEVGAVWSPGAPSTKLVGYKMQAIGDDPDPVDTLVWRPFSPPASGRVVLNPGGEANGDGAPSLLMDATSSLLVAAWSRNSVAGFDIVTSQFVDGAWTTPQVIVAGATNDLDPQLVQDAAGVIHLFYWADGASPQVFDTQTADLSSWSTPQLVSQPGEIAVRPAAAVYQGVLRVAYEVHDFGYGNSPREVVLSRFDGAAFVTEVVAMTNNLGTVSPQVHAHSGHLWVDWIDAQNAGAGEVAWTRLDAQGHWEPIHYAPFASAVERDYFVRGGVRMQAIQP